MTKYTATVATVASLLTAVCVIAGAPVGVLTCVAVLLGPPCGYLAVTAWLDDMATEDDE